MNDDCSAAAAAPWLARGLNETPPELPSAAIVRGRDGDGAALFALALARRRLLAGGDPARDDALLNAGSHPDFIRVLPIVRPPKIKPNDPIPCDGFLSAAPEPKDGAKLIRIGQIRWLNQACAIRPRCSDVKIAVILCAVEMNRGAANALLKTLEEPPLNVRILLVCERPRLLPPTVASRCRIIPAPTPSAAESREWLKQRKIAAAESLLAVCGGAPLAALASTQTAPARAALLAFLRAEAGVLESAAALAKAKIPPALWLDWMQKWLADAAAAACGLPPRFYPNESAALGKTAAALAGRSIFDFARTLARFRAIADRQQDPRLLLEDILYRYRRAAARGRDSKPRPARC